MPKPPRKSPPMLLKTDVGADAVSGRALVAKATDPRQAGLFETPLPKWIKPCLPTLVDKPPTGLDWVHEIKWDPHAQRPRLDGALPDETMARSSNGSVARAAFAEACLHRLGHKVTLRHGARFVATRDAAMHEVIR